MRRIYNPMQYEFLQHLQHWNVFITYRRASCWASSQILFVINFFWTLFAGREGAENPWNANTLEWAAPSPPPHLQLGPDAADRVPRALRVQRRPSAAEDFLPQTQPPARAAARARGH